ncbi:hypothetical protein C478_17836 [Natrinema thermotolerans DSM 11552]|nr:hypothetical protein C478_17836 [Natrinema thermotolerans DSM 11552]
MATQRDEPAGRTEQGDAAVCVPALEAVRSHDDRVRFAVGECLDRGPATGDGRLEAAVAVARVDPERLRFDGRSTRTPGVRFVAPVVEEAPETEPRAVDAIDDRAEPLGWVL